MSAEQFEIPETWQLRELDDTKLLGRNSWWEFCRWDRVDTIGFLACCAVSAPSDCLSRYW